MPIVKGAELVLLYGDGDRPGVPGDLESWYGKGEVKTSFTPWGRIEIVVSLSQESEIRGASLGKGLD